ncbi:hypothetical protein chiPu_0020397 [Chiloscyllium punctatum]|uniref:Uncharacterized protein n=1 Tax=Chiloscyllium punctatum TaxID=137246 RepID=A0A401RF60_CHIPU|nr:hypothetical protein [Chiloscyllium punctatum]
MVWMLGQKLPGDWAWCCLATRPVELRRLGRCSQLTRPDTVWRLGPVQPGDWAHCGLEAEHGVARRLWLVQSEDLAWFGLETVPSTVWTLSLVQPGDRSG